MSDVTQILNAIEQGDGQDADKLLPLVYEELRRMAAQKMSQEKPGQTLQATALVHETYIRLVEGAEQNWNSRGHFFKAAAVFDFSGFHLPKKISLQRQEKLPL